jgi:c-di-GMP-related signal transduction protein
MAGLGLSDKIWNALSEKKGEIAILLRIAKMVERIKLDEAIDCLTKLGIPLTSALECQKRAFNWHERMTCQ